MDEDMIHFIHMASMDHLVKSEKAGELADKLETFVSWYPDPELRRLGLKMAKRLHSIQESSA